MESAPLVFHSRASPSLVTSPLLTKIVYSGQHSSFCPARGDWFSVLCLVHGTRTCATTAGILRMLTPHHCCCLHPVPCWSCLTVSFVRCELCRFACLLVFVAQETMEEGGRVSNTRCFDVELFDDDQVSIVLASYLHGIHSCTAYSSINSTCIWPSAAPVTKNMISLQGGALARAVPHCLSWRCVAPPCLACTKCL